MEDRKGELITDLQIPYRVIIFGAEKAGMPNTGSFTSGQNKWKKFAIQSNKKSIAAMEAIPLSNKMI